MTHLLKLDADESIFFARELDNIKAQSRDVKYPELKFAGGMLLPISTEADSADTTITYPQYDQVGISKIISNYADDLPSVDVSAKEFTSPIRSLGNSFTYSIQEIKSARKTGKPLNQRRVQAAVRADLQSINSIAFNGDAESGLPGFFTNPNIGDYTLPADGAGASTKFSTKTADQILRDLNGMATSVSTITKGMESPDTMLVSLATWNLLTTLRLGDTLGTVLKFFTENSPHISNVEWVNELTDAGGAGFDGVMMYKRDPMNLTLELPMKLEQSAPQERNLSFVVNNHSRIGGVIIYYPLSVVKTTGA